MVTQKKLITKIPDLKENEIYISHVGDGEYMFNIFGGAYSDLNLFLCVLAKDHKCTLNDFSFWYYFSGHYFISLKHYDTSKSKIYYYDVGYITIEKTDPLTVGIIKLCNE